MAHFRPPKKSYGHVFFVAVFGGRGVFVRFFRSNQGPQLEAKVMDCRSPSQLAKADLPSTSCDWKMFMSMDGFFQGVIKMGPTFGEKQS